MKKDFIIALVLFIVFIAFECAVFFGYTCHEMKKDIDKLQIQNRQLRSVIDSIENNYCGVTEYQKPNFEDSEVR